MKILVVCRPRDGVDPRTEIAPRAGGEMEALRRLRDEGWLLESYSPGGPGAVLIFEGPATASNRRSRRFRSSRDGVIAAELTELHPFQALTE